MASANTTTATATDYQQIKAMLAAYRQIFKSVLENITHECVDSFTVDTTTMPPSVILHASPEMTAPLTAKGRAAFSPQIPYDLQTSMMCYSQCDFSSLCFLDWITETLRPMRAYVECLLIAPMRPAYNLKYAFDEGPAECRHSVFVITTASREQYIADFTLEQYGLPPDSWFVEKTEYLDRFTEGIWRIATQEDMEETDVLIASQVAEQRNRNCIDAICQEISWPAYRRLPVDLRMPWVGALTKDVMARIEAEELLAMTEAEDFLAVEPEAA